MHPSVALRGYSRMRERLSLVCAVLMWGYFVVAASTKHSASPVFIRLFNRISLLNTINVDQRRVCGIDVVGCFLSIAL